MLHEGMEGYIPGEGITIEQAQLIRDAGINYLALGHIHSPYDVGGWIYNPGSLERTAISDNVGGVYIIDTEVGSIIHKKHAVRPVHKLVINVTGKTDDDIKEEVKNKISKMSSDSILSLKFEGKVERIFNAKIFEPAGFFYVITSNETYFKSIMPEIKNTTDIEKEVINQIAGSRKDIRDLIFGMIDLLNDKTTTDDIMNLIEPLVKGGN
jgi:DNA repair exonuclease SbcCD nuclease subunit